MNLEAAMRLAIEQADGSRAARIRIRLWAR